MQLLGSCGPLCDCSLSPPFPLCISSLLLAAPPSFHVMIHETLCPVGHNLGPKALRGTVLGVVLKKTC